MPHPRHPATCGVQLALEVPTPGIRPLRRPTWSTSALFRGGPLRARIRPVIRHDRWEEQSYVSLFPSRFRRRRSLLEHPIPAGELTLPHGWVTGALRTPSGLPRCARSRHGWGGCPLYSGTGGVHAADRGPTAAACRFPTASPTPRHRIPSAGPSVTKCQRGFTVIHPSSHSPCL